MVNTANALHDLHGRERRPWAAGSISGLRACIRSWPTPRRSMTSPANRPRSSAWRLTDASEVRRVLQVAAEADNPTHLDLSLDQQRAKRPCACPHGRMGWAITGCSTRSTGDPGRNPGIVHRPRTPTTPPLPAQRRADALTDMSKAAAANTHPGGVSAVSILVDLENLPTSDNATPGRRHPWGAGSFIRPVVRAAVCTVIFGIKRTGTFIPLALGRKRRRASAAHRGADRPRPRLHPLRTDPACTATPTTSSTGKTAAEPTCRTWHSLFEMS